jgi:hypothetical protein
MVLGKRKGISLDRIAIISHTNAKIPNLRFFKVSLY